MAAKDYRICPALFSAYIGKVSKTNPNKMTSDKREITESEVLNLIVWWSAKRTKERDTNEHVITDSEGNVVVEIKYCGGK